MASTGWFEEMPIDITNADMLPIIGQDPNHVHVIYASGHSKNGVLLAPLTGEIVAALVTGAAVPIDLTALAPSRA